MGFNIFTWLLKNIVANSAYLTEASSLIGKVKKFASFNYGDEILKEVFGNMENERTALINSLKNMIENGADKDLQLQALKNLEQVTNPLEILNRLPEDAVEFTSLDNFAAWMLENHDSLYADFVEMRKALENMGHSEGVIYAKLFAEFGYLYTDAGQY